MRLRFQLFALLPALLALLPLGIGAQTVKTWNPDPAMLARLDPEDSPMGFCFRPPKGYESGSPDGQPDGVHATAWLGPQRSNKTQPTIMVILTKPPAKERHNMAERMLATLFKDYKAHRTNFVITPVDKGTINGITYLHATWTGYQPEYHGKMQGGFYVAEDRDLVIELVYQDVLPGASQTVALLDSSLRTFRKVSQKVYYSSQWLQHAQVWSMNLDGSEKVCLTTRSDTDYHPAVSPDGKTIAFTTHRSGVRSIWLMNPDGSNQHALTDKLDAGLCSWSPDGERLTFSSNRDGKYCIYKMRKDGSEVKKITDGPSDDCPSWGADGYIVYEGMVDGIWRILQVKANGKGIKPLTDDKAHARWPNISSDGGYILYTGYADKTGKSSHIYLMKSDGSMKTQLTKGEQSDREPCWTADGAQILFHSNRSGKYEVYSMESETLKPHQIAAETLDTREVTTAGRAYINP